MRAADFFTEVADPPSPKADPWDTPRSSLVLNHSLIDQLRRGPIEGRTEVELAIGLTELVHTQLQGFGTDSSHTLDDDEISAAIFALRAVLRRLTIQFDLPFRNFTTFRSHWIRNGASNSWQARRDMLDEIFEPLHLRLVRLLSPHAELGWPLVDEEIRELRRRFATSVTAQDYRAIGTHCIGVLEALGETVFDPKEHLREGETAPPRDKTKPTCVSAATSKTPCLAASTRTFGDSPNKAAALAQHVKHAPTPTRREAGIAGDAVILLANLLRRLEQQL